jgi:histidyl-tRNA synthetase
MSKVEPRTLKGFRDFLPEEQIARQKMVESIRKSYELFGFSPLETPTLEYADILTGKYSDEGDKLMYRFKDNGDRDVALRYDLTIPLARVVAQYGDIKKPFKRYQIANVFRADNPQKGRYREFCQCDADIIGSESVNADAEILALAGFVLEKLGVKDFEIRVNDRRLLDAFFGEEKISADKKISILRIIDKLDKIGEGKVAEELEEIGVGKEILKTIVGKKLPAGSELEKIINGAKKLDPKIKIVFDFSIARGLDYYTGLVFETKLLGAPEYGSVLSGGRYDNLVGTFANKSIPAVGMSVGIDRLFAALQELKLVSEQKSVTKVLVANFDETLGAKYSEIANTLRAAGINTEMLYEVSDLKKNLKYADDRGIPFVVIVGQDEAKEGKVTLKNLQKGTQEKVSPQDLIDALD